MKWLNPPFCLWNSHVLRFEFTFAGSNGEAHPSFTPSVTQPPGRLLGCSPQRRRLYKAGTGGRQPAPAKFSSPWNRMYIVITMLVVLIYIYYLSQYSFLLLSLLLLFLITIVINIINIMLIHHYIIIALTIIITL